jgi:hypothetical protein
VTGVAGFTVEAEHSLSRSDSTAAQDPRFDMGVGLATPGVLVVDDGAISRLIFVFVPVGHASLSICGCAFDSRHPVFPLRLGVGSGHPWR